MLAGLFHPEYLGREAFHVLCFLVEVALRDERGEPGWLVAGALELALVDGVHLLHAGNRPGHENDEALHVVAKVAELRLFRNLCVPFGESRLLVLHRGIETKTN